MKTNKELKILAKDIAESKVFTDRHIAPHSVESMLSMVFMPIVFGGKEIAEKAGKGEMFLIYEYYGTEAPRSVNGYPCFFSMRYLNKKETFIMEKYHRKYQRRQERFVAGGYIPWIINKIKKLSWKKIISRFQTKNSKENPNSKRQWQDVPIADETTSSSSGSKSKKEKRSKTKPSAS